VLGAWNRHSRSISGWPNTKLTRGVSPREYILPIEAFPEVFRADLKARAERLARKPLDDPFEMDISEEESSDDKAIAPLRRALRPCSIETQMDLPLDCQRARGQQRGVGGRHHWASQSCHAP